MNGYPNSPPELLEEIGQACHPLPGWTSVARCCEMADAIMETKPKIAVELGVFGGRTLVAQALAMRASGHGGIVVGLDPWRKEDALEGVLEVENRDWWSKVDLEHIHRTCMNVIWSRDLTAHCVVIRGASQDVAPLFGEIDYLYIDSNHSEMASMRDVETWVPKVRSGSYIWADDYDWPSVKPAYDLLKTMADVVVVGDEVLPDGTHKKGHYIGLRKK